MPVEEDFVAKAASPEGMSTLAYLPAEHTLTVPMRDLQTSQPVFAVTFTFPATQGFETYGLDACNAYDLLLQLIDGLASDGCQEAIELARHARLLRDDLGETENQG